MGLGGRTPYYDELGACVGWKAYCTCADGERARAEAEANAASSRRRRIARYLVDSKVPPRFAAFTLKASPQQELAKRMAAADTGASWLLWGEPGRGKTGLATAYLRLWIKRNARGGVFVPMPRLLSEIRETYRTDTSEMGALDYYGSIGLLALDDIGAESVSNTEWLGDRLYQVIGARHDHLRPTVFTSNLPPEKLAARLGERIYWRILEACGRENIVHVTGRNLRAEAG